ncbi:MAG: HAMP domain-containing histidine kinase [Erysipelotrichia bacterium]|nr:HAMP domain-containing histidine kinase [Erysipelotrichia bacterium]
MEKVDSAKTMDISRPQADQKKLEALGTMISGITHEINTPMHYLENNLTFMKLAFNDLLKLAAKYRQVLRGVRVGSRVSDANWQIIDAMEKEAEPEYLKTEISQALEQSLEGIRMVTRMVLALKDFSHPSLNDFSLTDVNKCIDTVCTISKYEWKRVADIKLDLARDLPYLFSSRDELHQVLLNLVINAAYAIGEKIAAGGYNRGHINISTKAVDEKIEIVVQNDGPEISPQNQELIFQPHFTTKAAGAGTGLGLYIVKQIVETAHGGKITVTSDNQTGTSFIIILPHRRNDA